MNRKIFNILSLFIALAMAFSAVSPAAAQPTIKPVSDSVAAKLGGAAGAKVTESPNGVYIVQMLRAPVAGNEGNTFGFGATKPAQGQKINNSSPDVINYRAQLNQEHDAVLAQVSGARKLYDYNTTFNGFAAKMSLADANKLAGTAGVANVTPDSIRTVDTSSTPSFLGLDAKGGLWSQLKGVGSAGEGIVIGVIDTGITPESLSFADRVTAKGAWTFSTIKGTKLSYLSVSNFNGACDLAGFTTIGKGKTTPTGCNNKLIGARHYNAAWGTDVLTGDEYIAANMPYEFLSAKDYNGHGTHTSSTAGGNYGVSATWPFAAFGKISGMAPRARIAMYKALWTLPDGTGSGYTSDLVEAIDQAVMDGVDVINYSISGTLTNFLDPVEIAFMFAADAGVFVAASAGNSGPAVSTVAHPSPWITTVAAGTHNRSIEGKATLGNSDSYSGASLADATVTGTLIDSVNAAAAGATAAAARLCYSTSWNGGSPALDSAKVEGKIVVCDRGGNDRVDKSLAVQEAGGIGMILVNVPLGANSIVADFHSVPTVHLSNIYHDAIKTYANTVGATATVFKAIFSYTAPAPFTADFSSRGPLIAGDGNLLKPDVIAPGQDILAAWSPADAGLTFDMISGTSMSSPHVAGLAALLKDLHPTWSPMMVKSALMTSAYDVLDDPNTDPSVIFKQGAGHVKPNSAADPGLVYDSGIRDWFAFLCNTTAYNGTPICDGLAGMHYSTNPSDFNSASIAIGALGGSETIKRTVTSVGGAGHAANRLETYTFSYSGLDGITVEPSTTSFTIGKGGKQTYSVTFTTNGAAFNEYVGGYITWTGNQKHVVRIPVVIRPVALKAPVEVSGTSDLSYDVTFGYGGTFDAAARGLVPADTASDTVTTGHNKAYLVTIPAGSTYTRFSIFNSTTTPGSDLDLYLFDDTFAQIASSGGGTSDEEINWVNLAPGDYYIMVDGYRTMNPSAFTLFIWNLDSTDALNMTVSAPASATIGATDTIGLTFSGLTPGVKYLGSVAYSGTTDLPDPTIVRVDP